MTMLTDKIRTLPPDKQDSLFRQLRPKSATAAPAASGKRLFRPAEDQNFDLVVNKPGLVETLAFRTRPRLSPSADLSQSPRPTDELIEVEIHAASLNFRDVAVALGLYPIPPGAPAPHLGCDGAGVVTAVGPQVTRVKVGDEVACLAASTFSRYTYTVDSKVIPKPATMTFEQAAGLPLAFITAHYGLNTVGRLRAGERVLIHSAAGGVGLAAVQIAGLVGAEIFATVGTQEKRDYLRSLGIQHIMDSRSLTFADDIRNVTRGDGVDVILNSLSGDAITEGMKLLRPLGRFVELGKRDLVAGRTLELELFRKSLSFAAIDIAQLPPTELRPIVEELSRRFLEGTLQPLPTATFPVNRLVDAFRFMIQGKHLGKLSVAMQSGPVMVDSPRP